LGRRRRKRTSELSSRAERDALRRERRGEPAAEGRGRRSLPARPGRPDPADRPPAPWGRFPLSELVILLGIGVLIWGAFSDAEVRNERIGAGLVIAALGGLELAVREHVAGFRSHSALLAGACAFAVVTGLALGPGPHTLGPLVIIGALVFAGSFFGLRELFRRRSGGLSWR